MESSWSILKSTFKKWFLDDRRAQRASLNITNAKAVCNTSRLKNERKGGVLRLNAEIFFIFF